MSSSPNLLDKDDDDEDPSADVDEEDDDNDDPSADVDDEEEEDDDPSADVDEEDRSSDEVTIEAIVEKKGRSRFQWSHNADCIVDNGNSKDKALIHITWQNLLSIVLETLDDGDKIFQGGSEATLKKRYQLYLDIGKKWDMEKEKRNQPENEEEKHDLNRSTVLLIHGGIEDLWEEFIMHKENEKEKKVEASRKEAIAKEGAEKIQQFAMGKLRKHDTKGSQKDKDVDIDCHLQTQKTPGN